MDFPSGPRTGGLGHADADTYTIEASTELEGGTKLEREHGRRDVTV